MEAVVWSVLGMGIGICLGIIMGERQHRKAVIQELRDERHVLTEALKQIQQAHNGLAEGNMINDRRLNDVEARVAQLNDGIKRGMR